MDYRGAAVPKNLFKFKGRGSRDAFLAGQSGKGGGGSAPRPAAKFEGDILIFFKSDFPC